MKINGFLQEEERKVPRCSRFKSLLPEGDRDSPTLETRNDTWDVPGYPPSLLPLQVGTEPSGMLHHTCSSLSTCHWYQPPQPGACIPTQKYQIKGILGTENPLTQGKVLLLTPLPPIPPGFGRQLYIQTVAWPIPKTRNIINKSLLLSLSQSFFKYPCHTT